MVLSSELFRPLLCDLSRTVFIMRYMLRLDVCLSVRLSVTLWYRV